MGERDREELGCMFWDEKVNREEAQYWLPRDQDTEFCHRQDFMEDRCDCLLTHDSSNTDFNKCDTEKWMYTSMTHAQSSSPSYSESWCLCEDRARSSWPSLRTQTLVAIWLIVIGFSCV